jgi:hypothetical protein
VTVPLETTHLFGVLQVPASLPATGVATDRMAGLSSSGSGRQRPHPRRPILGLSSGCPLGIHMALLSFYTTSVSLVPDLNLKGGPYVAEVIPL